MRINWQQYISSDAKTLTGKPLIKGTRISVEIILDKLAAGETPQTNISFSTTYFFRLNSGLYSICSEKQLNE